VHVDHTGERYYEAEVYRLKGELLLRQAVLDSPQAETCFQQALAIARRQEPGAPVAAAGQAHRGLRPARTDLWLVH
jgi:hypothetical protein